MAEIFIPSVKGKEPPYKPMNNTEKNPPIRVRFGEEKDIPAMLRLLTQVCAVHHAGRPDLFRAGGRKYDAPALAEMLRDPVRPVLVAADEKDALCAYAFCVLQVHEGDGAMNDGKTLYLDDLCVDEARRGEHIGKTLYLATVDYARRLGCHNLTLNAWSCNENAVRFYRAMGMQVQKYGMEVLL